MSLTKPIIAGLTLLVAGCSTMQEIPKKSFREYGGGIRVSIQPDYLLELARRGDKKEKVLDLRSVRKDNKLLGYVKEMPESYELKANEGGYSFERKPWSMLSPEKIEELRNTRQERIEGILVETDKKIQKQVTELGEELEGMLTPKSSK